MYIYSVSKFPSSPTLNPPPNTHVITYSCPTQSSSWTTWQRRVKSFYLFYHWHKCWFYIQYSLQTSFNTFQICWWPSTEAFTQYAIHLITSQKAENATEVTRTLQDMTNTPFTVKTVRRALRGTGMKAVTKQKRPFLSARHRRLRMDFAESQYA